MIVNPIDESRVTYTDTAAYGGNGVVNVWPL